MRHIIASRDVAHWLLSLDSRKRLAALMRREFRLAPHLHAARLRPGPAFARAGKDQLALELGQAAQHRQQQPPVWRGRVGPGFGKRQKTRLPGGDRRNCVQQVARGAGQTVEPRHHHHIAGQQAVDKAAQLRPVRLSPTGNFPEHLLAAGGPQLASLRLHALTVRRYPGIAINHMNILHRNYAPEKPPFIRGLGLVQNSSFFAHIRVDPAFRL